MYKAENFTRINQISFQFAGSHTKPFAINHEAPHFNFKKAKVHLLYDMLLSIDWYSINTTDNVETAVTYFYKTLRSVLTSCVLIHRFKQNQRFTYPPWFDQEIIYSLRQKWSAFKKYKHYETINLLI